MKIKTSELECAALDWAVATVEGREIVIHGVGQYCYDRPGGVHCCKYGCTFGPRNIQYDVADYSPSTEWSQGGPLIERYEVAISPEQFGWEAEVYNGGHMNPVDGAGKTPLIAAMRAIVASELGREVDIPEELI